MSSRTTGQQAAQGDELLSSNGSVQQPFKTSDVAQTEEEEKENVFLFAPNLIGTSFPFPADSQGASDWD